jgi:hypothetical protein
MLSTLSTNTNTTIAIFSRIFLRQGFLLFSCFLYRDEDYGYVGKAIKKKRIFFIKK